MALSVALSVALHTTAATARSGPATGPGPGPGPATGPATGLGPGPATGRLGVLSSLLLRRLAGLALVRKVVVLGEVRVVRGEGGLFACKTQHPPPQATH